MSPEKAEKKKERTNKPTLTAEEKRLLNFRTQKNKQRPRFVRTASHRYWRIGRRDSWRAPKGVQSKQRRHYGYRPTVVSIGFGGPAKVRGRISAGFRPVIIHTIKDLEDVEQGKQIVVIAHGVGTRKRLTIEEAAKKRNLRIANPLSRGGGKEE
jgi:large subunit ribosomal protein L32e